jgi:hypothetical protein
VPILGKAYEKERARVEDAGRAGYAQISNKELNEPASSNFLNDRPEVILKTKRFRGKRDEPRY